MVWSLRIEDDKDKNTDHRMGLGKIQIIELFIKFDIPKSSLYVNVYNRKSHVEAAEP